VTKFHKPVWWNTQSFISEKLISMKYFSYTFFYVWLWKKNNHYILKSQNVSLSTLSWRSYSLQTTCLFIQVRSPLPEILGAGRISESSIFSDFKTVIWFVYVHCVISPVESTAPFCYQAHYYYCCKMYEYSH
jgi:hypothetical protein